MFLSYDEQAERLLSRGLLADKDKLIHRLQSVNYYRLSGYLYPFRQSDSDLFQDGTTLDVVWDRYRFDRNLRFIILDGLERIEIALRTELAYLFTKEKGPFGYLIENNFFSTKFNTHKKFLKTIKIEIKRSKEKFVKHYFSEYEDVHSGFIPLWMAVEIMSFGTTLSFFRGIPSIMKDRIASKYGVTRQVFESWLVALNAIRNISAHHGRLWNRELGYKPKIPKKDNNWHIPVEIKGNRVFGVLSIVTYLLKVIAPQSKWPRRFLELLEEFPEIPLDLMGMPDNWMVSPIWKQFVKK